jgi:uncharacterized protein (DUF1697 family)
MPILISLLRAINLAGHRQLKMETLRHLYESLGFEQVQSYVQSGNILFSTADRDLVGIAARIRKAIEESAGFAPDVILRSRRDLEKVVSRNPFAGRTDIPPNKLLVTFFDSDPDKKAVAAVNAMKISPEEFRVIGRELYVHFPAGAGRSKFPAAAISKTLNVSGTARNWNTILKLLDMARKSEVSVEPGARPTIKK